jgi:hypothetical protein
VEEKVTPNTNGDAYIVDSMYVLPKILTSHRIGGIETFSYFILFIAFGLFISFLSSFRYVVWLSLQSHVEA